MGPTQSLQCNDPQSSLSLTSRAFAVAVIRCSSRRCPPDHHLEICGHHPRIVQCHHFINCFVIFLFFVVTFPGSSFNTVFFLIVTILSYSVVVIIILFFLVSPIKGFCIIIFYSFSFVFRFIVFRSFSSSDTAFDILFFLNVFFYIIFEVSNGYLFSSVSVSSSGFARNTIGLSVVDA